MTKKIMFNDKYCLTQAVLSRTKTMTRRVLKGNTQKHLPYKVGEVIAIAQPYKDIIQSLPMYSDAILCVDGIPRKEFKAGWTNKMFVKSELLPHRRASQRSCKTYKRNFVQVPRGVRRIRHESKNNKNKRGNNHYWYF